MSKLTEVTETAMGLPKDERIRLAQALWESIEDDDLPGFQADELKDELRQRLKDEPDDTWKPHEQVMNEARGKFGCGS